MKILAAVLGKWWLWMVFFIFFNLIGYLGMVEDMPLMGQTGYYGSVIFFFMLLASIVYLLKQRRWFVAILIGASTLGIIFLGSVAASVYYFDSDHFNDHLKMPVGIKLSTPTGLDARAHLQDSIQAKKPSTVLILYYDFQPGLYQYDFWTDKAVTGEVYLKAYEVTKNIALSEDDLKESSNSELSLPRPGHMLHDAHSHFKIYEGDWAKPYAARFEVWLRPGDHTADRKLYEDIYKIEGWQR